MLRSQFRVSPWQIWTALQSVIALLACLALSGCISCNHTSSPRPTTTPYGWSKDSPDSSSGDATVPDDPCDDDNPCTDDGHFFGFCSSAPVEDGTPCGASVPCQADSVCMAGTCTEVAVNCDDGNICTVDACGGTSLSKCTHEPVAAGTQCGAAKICAQPVCSSWGTCELTPVDCSDGNTQTVDTCGATGCVHTPLPAAITPTAPPDCANGVFNGCGTCPADPVCADGITWTSACAAISLAQAVTWTSGACPSCKACTAALASLQPAWAVQSANGLKLDLADPCQAWCVPDLKLDASGGAFLGKGAWKTECSGLPVNGVCPLVDEPVCAEEDGQTYRSVCALQHCDLDECAYPGASNKGGCTPGAMHVACAGECYNAAKAPGCGSACAPTCGAKILQLPDGVTQTVYRSFRNTCTANAAGWSAMDCSYLNGLGGSCAASLYVNHGCCEGVDYGAIAPVCASSPVAGKPDKFVTFRNQQELLCFAGSDPSWTFQYDGPCVCSCTNNSQFVCGGDGLTYLNACQAECFGGPDMPNIPGRCQSP